MARRVWLASLEALLRQNAGRSGSRHVHRLRTTAFSYSTASDAKRPPSAGFPSDLAPQLLANLNASGISAPTTIQTKAYTPIQSGKHVILTAETGSGKTLAYLVPLLNSLLDAKTREEDATASQRDPVRSDNNSQPADTPRRKSPRLLILVPSHHLQLQVLKTIGTLIRGPQGRLPLSCTMIPLPFGVPESRLSNPDIGISTVGAIQQHYKKTKDLQAFLEHTHAVVMDEADWTVADAAGERLLDRVRAISKKRQPGNPLQLVFSAATLAPIKSKNAQNPRAVIWKALRDIATVSTDSLHTVSPRIAERFISMPTEAEGDTEKEFAAKLQALLQILGETVDDLPLASPSVPTAPTLSSANTAMHPKRFGKWLVFCGTSHRAESVGKELEMALLQGRDGQARMQRGLTSVRVVHGDMEKASRSQTILTFAEKTAGPHDAAAAPSMCDSSNEIHILVASDVVARGVDFRDLNRVIHFDFAKDAAEYLHRVGRVARDATMAGDSIGFIMARNVELAKCIEEASGGSTGVKDPRLLNHNQYAADMMMEPRIGDDMAGADNGQGSALTDGQTAVGKYPLTGILSRKRSFSK